MNNSGGRTCGEPRTCEGARNSRETRAPHTHPAALLSHGSPQVRPPLETQAAHPTPRSGVALIIVMGLLAFLLLAAVAFMRSVRTTQQATRNVLDDLRARQLVHVALARALEAASDNTRGYTYPYWTNGVAHDATASTSGVTVLTNVLVLSTNGVFTTTSITMITNSASVCGDFLVGDATNYIPLALWDDANWVAKLHVATNLMLISGVTNLLVTTNCYSRWITVTTETGIVHGQIAYLIVNCSGLVDANYFGVTNLAPSRDCRTELDISGLPEFDDVDAFVSDFVVGRKRAVRYESLPELQRLGNGLDPSTSISNLFILSHDPGWSVCPPDTNELGHVTNGLLGKLHVNRIGNSAAGTGVDRYRTDSFRTNDFALLTNRLAMAGLSNRVEAIAWNIVNYLDSDCVPQTDSESPWLDDCGVEAVPLINEIILRPVGSSTCYEFVVELWYPSFPKDIAESNFVLQVAVADSDPGRTACTSRLDLTAWGSPAWSFTSAVGPMRFGDSNEFLCFTSPVNRQISFTNYLPIGGTNLSGGTNLVWVAARVVKDGIPVDHAMDASGFTCFTSVLTCAVNDPRMNGIAADWVTFSNSTPGMMNAGCDPWTIDGQGLPIQHQDGLIASIGMLGYVYAGRPWHSLDLLDADNGAGLPDYLTALDTDPPRGFLCGNSRQTPVLEALFHGVTLGLTNSATSSTGTMSLADERSLALAFYDPDLVLTYPTNRYLTFRHMLSEVGSTTNFTDWKPGTNVAHVTSDMKEDAFRENLEWISFRQNIFTIILAAQSFAKDQATVVAEKRAVAVVYRDSYTGRTRLCYFKWLED